MIESWLARAEGPAAPASPDVATVAGADAAPRVAHAVFDEASFLDRMMGDSAMASEVAKGFLLDMPKQIAELESALSASNASSAERRAHRIRGAAATVSGCSMADVAGALEETSKVGDLSRASALCSNLRGEFARLKTSIDRWLTAHRAADPRTG
jgi:HPt (histidine-containing phosphotransfer) domain-containing protein